MSEQPAEPAPAPEPGKGLANTRNPALYCPVCRLPEIRYAHDHCPKHKDGTRGCPWRICKCGTTWDTITGRHHPPENGADTKT